MTQITASPVLTADDIFVSPLLTTIDRMQNAGLNAYVRGLTADGAYALVMSNGNAFVAPVSTANGIGRWECSGDHLGHYGAIYAERFPRRLEG